MKCSIAFKYLFLFLLFPARMIAQDIDITGIWKGDIYIDSTKQLLPFEVSISENKGKLTGYSYITFEENGIKRVGVMAIKIKQKDDIVIIEDDEYINNNFERPPPKQIKKTMVLTLSTKDTIRTIKGEWSTNKSKRFLTATGKAELHRKTDYKSTALYKKLEEIKLADNLVFTEPKKTPEPVVVVNEPPKEIIKPVIVTPPPPVIEEPKKPEPVIAKIDTPKKVIKPVEQPIAVVKKPEVKPVPPPVIPPAPKPVPPPVAAKPQPKPVPQPVAVKPQPKPVVVPAPKPVAAPPKPVPPQVAVVKPAPPKPVAKTVIVQDAIAKNIAANVVERKTNTLQTVYYKSDSLVLTLYDNGEIDGDTVSVLMNGQVIIAKQGLNTKYNAKSIYIDKDTPDTIKLVMFAENLGSIPPNTGLMVVHDGESVYEVRFSADLKTNAQIILTRRKENE